LTGRCREKENYRQKQSPGSHSDCIVARQEHRLEAKATGHSNRPQNQLIGWRFSWALPFSLPPAEARP
jgi:hypothetical protein